MKWMQRDENIKVEIKDHLEKFHTYFYQYDAFNVEKSLEKSLWFGGNSIEQLYIKRKMTAVYKGFQLRYKTNNRDTARKYRDPG